jgi:hypothetical protein
MTMDADQAQVPGPPHNSPMFWLVAFVVVGGLVLFGIKAIKGSDPVDPGDDAKRVCQEEFIADRLKAPASADYSDVEVSASGDVYEVTGKVDSQNSFGAKVRSSFRCVVRDAGDEWRLVSASVS